MRPLPARSPPARLLAAGLRSAVERAGTGCARLAVTTGPSAGCGRSSAASAVDGAAGAAAARSAGAASAGRGAAAAISAPALLAANKAGPARFGTEASTGAFAGLVGAATSTASPRRSVRFGSLCTDAARWPERSTTARMAVPRSAPNPMAMKGRGEANAPARPADEVRRAERRELTSGDTAYPHARCRRFGSPQARPSSASTHALSGVHHCGDTMSKTANTLPCGPSVAARRRAFDARRQDG